MQVQKIQNNNYNTNFKGFEFKNAHAQKVFESKLNKYSDAVKNSINNYMKMTENEPVKVIIDATRSRLSFDEHIVFATFSNNENLVVERSLSLGTTRLKEFINRCAAQAGYQPFKGI